MTGKYVKCEFADCCKDWSAAGVCRAAGQMAKLTTATPLLKSATTVGPPAVPSRVYFEPGTFVNEQGLTLYSYRWSLRTLSEPKGIVQLCHGYSSHTTFEWLLPSAPGGPHEKYDGSVIAGLVESGWIVIAIDQQSHGRSEGVAGPGVRCYFGEFEDLVTESLGFNAVQREEMAARYPSDTGQPLPAYVWGQSMGGATACRMACREKFDGMLLYAPMLSLEKVKEKELGICGLRNKHLMPLVGCLSSCCPMGLVAKTEKNIIHPESQVEFDSDPYNFNESNGSKSCARNRTSFEFTSICDDFGRDGSPRSLRTVGLPFIVYHSEKDGFTDPEGSAMLYNMSNSADKTYKRIGVGLDLDLNIWHALSVEPGREVILADALAWLESRSSIGKDS